MKLTEEQFTIALNGLGCGENSIHQESRNGPRIPMGTRAMIIPCGELGRREQETVVLLNISESGVGFLNTAAMRIGDTFILRVPPLGKQLPLAILSTVVHCQSFATGMYSHGAQFSRILPGKIEPIANGPTFKSAEEIGEADQSHLKMVEGRLSQIALK